MRILDDIQVHVTLQDYETVGSLVGAVDALRSDAASLVPRLAGRTVWMLNSTAQGGGVAELLPAQIAILRELGVEVRWAVLESDHQEFFAFTKRLHNLIHGAAEPHPSDDDRVMFERVNRQNALDLSRWIAPSDIVLVHDPQPLAAGTFLKEQRGVRLIWRCHIGLDAETPHTRAAWDFLQPYTAACDEVVFSLDEYIPSQLRSRASVIPPSIDPATHKNRELSLHKLVGILCDAGLARAHWPLLDAPFPARAERLQTDGTFAPALLPDDIGLLARPIVTQVSRWDQLKGFAPLMEAFRRLKRGHLDRRDDRHARRVELVRLVLAGPEPAAIQDDPEALSVIEALIAQYRALEPEVQRDVALLTLPMNSRKHNALMVNALQRASDIIVQNSLREGFGLTVTEAMWKRTPVLGSRRAAGVRLQVRDAVDGRLAEDPEDPDELAGVLHDMLADESRLDAWGHSAQRRVHDDFLVFTELRRWLRLLAGSP